MVSAKKHEVSSKAPLKIYTLCRHGFSICVERVGGAEKPGGGRREAGRGAKR
jgi:hypothetical protein